MIFIVLPLSLADYWANWNKKVVEPATLLFCPPSGGMAAHLNFPLIRGLFPGNTKGGQFLGKSPWVTLPPSAEKGGKPRLHLIRGKSVLKKSGRRRRRRRRTNPSPSPLSQEHKGRGGGGGLLSTLFSYYEKELASKWGISLCAHANKTKWCFAFSLFLRLSGVIFFRWISHTAITDVLRAFLSFSPLPLISFFWMPPPAHPPPPPPPPPFLFSRDYF